MNILPRYHEEIVLFFFLFFPSKHSTNKLAFMILIQATVLRYYLSLQTPQKQLVMSFLTQFVRLCKSHLIRAITQFTKLLLRLCVRVIQTIKTVVVRQRNEQKRVKKGTALAFSYESSLYMCTKTCWSTSISEARATEMCNRHWSLVVVTKSKP